MCLYSSGSGTLPKMKVQIISGSYCLIWTHIRESFATKLLAGSGKGDSSTMLAMGLRNLGLSIETTEAKGGGFFLGIFSFFVFLMKTFLACSSSLYDLLSPFPLL